MAVTLDTAEATKCLMAYIKGGALGPTAGTGTAYSIVEETAIKIVFMAALMSFATMGTVPLDRYIIEIDRHSGEVISSELASITHSELEAMFVEAGIGHLDTFERFKDGAFSVSYKAFCDSKAYIVQLRSNGNMDTIHAVHQLIHQKCPDAVPTPQIFKAKTEPQCKLPVQISEFVPGVMADAAYPGLAFNEKVRLLKRIARAFDAVWSLMPSSKISQIGEALIDPDNLTLSIGPDRRFQLGGPFSSVSSYLESWIKRRVLMLQEQHGVDEFKAKYLDRILQVTGTLSSRIPDCVNQVPLVLTHADMGLHNMILDSSPPHDLKAVIDWEFVYCYPFPFSVSRHIEPMFSEDSEPALETVPTPGSEQTGTLRSAFWEEIPEWRDLLAHESSQVFLDFYNFGLFLKVEALRGGPSDVETKWNSWSRNCKVVDVFLDRYGISPLPNM